MEMSVLLWHRVISAWLTDISRLAKVSFQTATTNNDFAAVLYLHVHELVLPWFSSWCWTKYNQIRNQFQILYSLPYFKVHYLSSANFQNAMNCYKIILQKFTWINYYPNPKLTNKMKNWFKTMQQCLQSIIIVCFVALNKKKYSLLPLDYNSILTCQSHVTK